MWPPHLASFVSFHKNVLETNWEALTEGLFFCWFAYIHESGFISFLSLLNVCVCVYLCMSVCVGSCVFMLYTSVWMPRTPGVSFGDTVHLLWDRVSLFWGLTSRQDWLISEPQGSFHRLCLPRAGITSSCHHNPCSSMGSRDWTLFMLKKASVFLTEPYSSPLIPLSSCSTLCP